MSVFSVIKSIGGTVLKVGHILLPILHAFREASPEVDMALDTVEDVIEEGGEIADDFLDRNLPTIEAAHEFFVDLKTLADSGVDLTAYIIRASQVETPNSITPSEAQRIGQLLIRMQETLPALIENSDGLMAKVEEMK